jgi:hypothetical protein
MQLFFKNCIRLVAVSSRKERSMSIFQKLFGGADTKPEDIPTLADAAAALDRLRAARAENAARERELIAGRRAAIEGDASDATILKMDRELEKLVLESERLDVLEPRIIARLSELQSADRAALLAQLRGIYETRVAELDRAMEALLEPLGNLQEILRQLDVAGFSGEARAFVVPPPYLGAGGVAISAETLENWRQQREHNLDMHALAAAPRPAPTPAPPPAPKAPERVRLQDAAYRPAPTRAARKVEEEPSFGFMKIAVLRNGLEIAGEARVIGDELILPVSDAERLARTGAVDIVARGEVGRAAE